MFSIIFLFFFVSDVLSNSECEKIQEMKIIKRKCENLYSLTTSLMNALDEEFFGNDSLPNSNKRFCSYRLYMRYPLFHTVRDLKDKKLYLKFTTRGREFDRKLRNCIEKTTVNSLDFNKNKTLKDLNENCGKHIRLRSGSPW